MLEDVGDWLARLGIEPTAAIELIHDRPWSSVLRVPTADGDLYLKRCAPVQAFEVPLTVTLAARWPDRVPEVVGSDVERAWLLIRDGGTRLRESEAVEPFAAALALYGELQVAEAAQVDGFLGLGVPDARLPIVAAEFEPFLEREHGLTAGEVDRLRALVPRFRELCEELQTFGLPASIQHDDLHDLNVFVRDGRVRILDWGDSSIGHPLWSWLKPLDVASRRGIDPDGLRTAYLAAWTRVAPEERLREALRVAVPVGRFAYALQWQRQLDAMPATVQPDYRAYMPEQLRRLLALLEAAE